MNVTSENMFIQGEKSYRWFFKNKFQKTFIVTKDLHNSWNDLLLNTQLCKTSLKCEVEFEINKLK